MTNLKKKKKFKLKKHQFKSPLYTHYHTCQHSSIYHHVSLSDLARVYVYNMYNLKRNIKNYTFYPERGKYTFAIVYIIFKTLRAQVNSFCIFAYYEYKGIPIFADIITVSEYNVYIR